MLKFRTLAVAIAGVVVSVSAGTSFAQNRLPPVIVQPPQLPPNTLTPLPLTPTLTPTLTPALQPPVAAPVPAQPVTPAPAVPVRP